MLVYPAIWRFSAWLTRLHTVNGTTDVDNNAGLVTETDAYVTIATFDKTTDAHIAMGRLVAEGIPAQLFDDNMVQMDWLYSIALGGIKLRVARVNEHPARLILATDYSHELDDVDVGKPEP